jgi:hypothetical protein
LRRTKDFEHWAEYARRLIADEVKISDVILMVKLNFTPTNWKAWKSKLIEWFSLKKYEATIRESGKKVQYRIVYIKTDKTWNLITDD